MKPTDATEDASFDALMREVAASPEVAVHLTTGAVVDGRFELGALLGQGGFGRVYAARDLMLARDVAIKLLGFEAKRRLSEQALAYFVREAQATAQLNHPNIVTLHDYGVWQGVPFLVLERLAGESLAARFTRGPMAPLEALRIARDLARALAHAHAAGVIHRDLKPSNVFLLPDGTAKVLDFGIARLMRDDVLTSEAVPGATQGSFGTPGYMAPEQEAGEAADARTDQFAFGVVLAEMLLGRAPSSGAELPTPRSRLARRLMPMVRRMLAAQPEHRFPTMQALSEAIDAALSRETTGRITRRWLAAAVACATAATAIAVPLAMRPPSDARLAIGVLGFDNLTQRAEHAWMNTAMVEALSTDLAAGGALHVIPPAVVAERRGELGVVAVSQLDAAALGKLREFPGLDAVVVGSYAVVDGRVRLNARVQRTARAALAGAASAEQPESRFFEAARAVATALRQSLGAPSLPGTPAASGVPAELDAARLYAEGLSSLRRYDGAAARTWLERAAALAPSDPYVHAALASAWALLGYSANAAREARSALQDAGHLAAEARARLEGTCLELLGDARGARARLAPACAAHPDDVDTCLQLVRVQARSGDTRDAASTLAALGRLPAADRDPRLALAAAELADARSDYSAQQAHAERAVQQALAVGARLVAARAHLLRAHAHKNVGRYAEAAAAAASASAIYGEAGERGGVARAIHHEADALSNAGDLSRARARYEAALAIYRDIGYEGVEVISRVAYAVVLANQGEMKRAVEAVEAALTTRARLGDAAAAPWVQIYCALVLVWAGELERAEALAQAGLATERRSGRRNGIGWALYVLALVAQARNDAGGASAFIREAESHLRAVRHGLGVPLAAALGAELAVSRGDVADARARLEGTHADAEAWAKLRLALARAQLNARTDAAGAAKALSEVTADARRLGFAAIALEAELARATQTKPASAERLAAIEADARARGLGLVALRARAARTRR